jgi:ubiquinone/menaquinone biosynthesis C-methylase UbiE
MEILKNLTGQIQTNLSSNFDIRARYLYSLYQSLSIKFKNKNNYIDIGCGSGINTAVFGNEFNQVFCSDFCRTDLIACREFMMRKDNVYYIAADAQSLPFKNGRFDLVTGFSLIEHVPEQEKMLNEAFRILKKNGQLILQFPNKYFFMELHTGIPFYWMVPDFMKPWILTKISYDGFLKIPTPAKIINIIRKIEPCAYIRVIEVIYPDELVPDRFKKVYSVLKKTGILGKIPFGWMVICEKG